MLPDGLKLRHRRLSPKLLLVEVVTPTKAVVAYARFHVGADFVEADDTEGDDSLWVDAKFRRKGLATLMYDLAEKVCDLPLIPSEHLSGAGEAFWKHRVQTLPKDHPAHDWY